ncbi:MAG: ABC transporter substrate-binding protein [Chloroflexi bacterium]|nr:ABC transporter substrate-binding protein [Chloroflexota bacterium]
MKNRSFEAWAFTLALVLAACAQAATPNPTPTTAPAAKATSTATPGSAPVVRTPTSPPGVTVQPSPTPRPASAPTAPTTIKPKYGGVFKVPTIGDPPLWDAMVLPSASPHFRLLNAMVFEVLARPGGSAPPDPCSYAIENSLASSWKYLDPTTLEIKVHQGVKFHNKPPVNGRELTAEDVAYSLRRVVKLHPRMTPAAAYIESIEAKDRYTVVISLKQPHGGFTASVFLGNVFAGGILAPESGGTKESWGDPSTSWIGTGPFMFRQHLPGVKAVFDRNPNYWKAGLPYVDRIEIPIMPDPSTRLAALRAGKLDAHTRWGLTWALVSPLKATSPEVKVLACPGMSQVLSSWRIDEPPFDDVRVRRAVSMLLDRKALAEKVWEGQATVVAMFSSQLHPLFLDLEGLPPEVRKYAEYRPEEAIRLLAEAGYPGGKGLEVTLNHTLGTTRQQIEWSEFLIESMVKAGIKVTPKWMEYNRYALTYLAGDYHGMGTGGVSVPDPYAVFDIFVSTVDPTMNKGRVKDAELDRLIAEFFGTVDEAKSQELSRRIQVRMFDQVYVLVAPFTYFYALSQPWVRGYLVANEASAGLWAEKVWLDK